MIVCVTLGTGCFACLKPFISCVVVALMGAVDVDETELTLVSPSKTVPIDAKALVAGAQR